MCHIGHHLGWDLCGVGKKSPSKVNGAQLNRKAQTCVISLAACNELTIAVINMEIASQLK